MILAAVLSGFVLSLVAPWLYRMGRGATGWIIALLPIGLTLYFFSLANALERGWQVSYTWVPSMGINLSFYIDGLSLLFALLISGIGALIIIYGGGYLAGHPKIAYFYSYILIFMASMLGLVLADNIITMFIFWELTSISSYLLIGFDHHRAEARAAAMQALLVTGGGGLALLAGLILMNQVGGSWELSELVAQGELIRQNQLYLPILLLVLLGAFTKSAQFPFHFWLPGAMQAPTPVSAYLHSATMVKAGVYLLARFSPILAGTEAWFYIVTLFGAVTMLVGSALALLQTDLKRLLAYSTVSALGTLVMLLGLDTHLAAEAAIVFLILHSFYKGSLFLVAGAIDHETGTRDVTLLGRLFNPMPIVGTAALLAGLSMAGFPPMLGFIGKELAYESTTHIPGAAIWRTTAAVVANMGMVAVAGIVTLWPFLFGPKGATPKKPHRAPLSLWLGPAVLAGLGLLTGLVPSFFTDFIVSSAVSEVLDHTTSVHLALFHGLNLPLLLSLVTVLGGVGLFLSRNIIRNMVPRLDVIMQWGPERWYELSLKGLERVSLFQTRILQNGYLRYYLTIIIMTTVLLVGYTLLAKVGLKMNLSWPYVRFYEGVVAVVILVSAFYATRTSSRLAAVAALGAAGYGVALLFIFFGAPDLAMTQFSIETLSVVLLVLILYRLPRFSKLSGKPARTRDTMVALSVGGLMTLLVLTITALPLDSRLTPYFAENSYLLAHGHNVVNVILVDFRGVDTMGEITVLSVAGIGVFALLKLTQAKSKLLQAKAEANSSNDYTSEKE